MNRLKTLKDFNAWRRGDDAFDQPDPKAIGEAIDWAIRVCKSAENFKRVQGSYHAEFAANKLFDTLE